MAMNNTYTSIRIKMNDGRVYLVSFSRGEVYHVDVIYRRTMRDYTTREIWRRVSPRADVVAAARAAITRRAA